MALKTLLITGGTGFFGKSILDAYGRGVLDRYGVGRIVIVARSATRLSAELPEICPQNVELVDADVAYLNSTFNADWIIHAAASSNAARYRDDPGAESRVIEEGTQNLCRVIAKARRPSRLVYVSSGAVYGAQPEDLPALAEDAPFAPVLDPGKSAYANAKRHAELIVSRFAAANSLPACIARCFAFVGPWLPRDMHFAIGNFLGDALARRPIAVRATHPVIRSYLHGDDLAVWLMALAAAAHPNCNAFNVGSDEAISIQDLASMVGEVAGVGVQLAGTDREVGADARMTVDRYVPDISKVRREVGVDVTIRLRDAIVRTLDALCAQGRFRRSEAAGVRGTLWGAR